jgi:hypothetical protein
LFVSAVVIIFLLTSSRSAAIKTSIEGQDT